MTDTSSTDTENNVGLFLLQLESESAAIGAPILHLNLTVDTVNETTNGIAEVTQALANPLVCTSHVTGPVIYQTVMGPGSTIRLNLTGYPVIHWPSGGGVGPVLLKNLTATVVLDQDWQSGDVRYQYQDKAGNWHNIYNQQIHAVNQQAAKVAAE